MWLTQSTSASSSAQQLGLLNWVPQTEENDFALSGIKETESGQKILYTNVRMIRNARIGALKSQFGMSDWSFQGLRKTIEKLNEKLKEKPIEG